MRSPLVLWFRNDLRLKDNPAFNAACLTGAPIIPLYILDDEAPGKWRLGGAQRWWLHHSLTALSNDLKKLGLTLILRQGPAEKIIDDVITATDATALYWSRRYEPWAIFQDTNIKQDFTERGLDVKSFNARLIAEPWKIQTRSGTPYKVYTPFWKAVLGYLHQAPEAVIPIGNVNPEKQKPIELKSDLLSDWHLLPTKPDWSNGLQETWTPGEAAAQQALKSFIDDAITDYKNRRDFPGRIGTSRLSPHLAFGEIGPRQLWDAIQQAQQKGDLPPHSPSIEQYRKEIVWREFAYHLMLHFPETTDTALVAKYRAFPWRQSEKELKAWQRGKTGYPIVDAGMRELWQTGWMHNRVRMIVASFLVKHLLLSWQEGAAWFWDTLVDADLASNTLGWQWAAGCGADAAPYFRIFNPATQTMKFDASGDYIRRYVPELAALPDKNLADLSKEPLLLEGISYPLPIVDHAMARKRALEALASIKA